MQKVLSTYLLISRKLNAELLAQISVHGFSALEIFCSRAHFAYTLSTSSGFLSRF
jgi:hypothetical protein